MTRINVRHAFWTGILGGIAFIFATATATATLNAQDMRWTRVDLPETGISLQVPLGVFRPSNSQGVHNGQLFATADGRAKLLVGALPNIDGLSVRAYRDYVMRTNYPNSKLDYAPLRKNWFVVSGTVDEIMFYQRVSFRCANRLINSWAMVYPVAERDFYDRIVERVHKHFRAGRGANGSCQLREEG